MDEIPERLPNHSGSGRNGTNLKHFNESRIVPFFSSRLLYRNFLAFSLLVLFIGCGESEGPSSQPESPQELIINATEKQRIGAFNEAVEILNQALKLSPDSVEAYYRMGRVHDEADNRDEAIAAFKKALQIEPDNLKARLGLGDVYSKMTRNDLAVAEFLKAEAQRPDDTELLFKIALEYWYDQKLNESAKYYQKILAIEPDHVQSHLNLISVYEKLKNWDKAIEEIEISKRLGRETNNDQAIAIAKRKLAFIKGRMGMSEKDYKRKTQPPFD
ncbi:MAG: tetratricopeptide repeat protein [Nitrospinae bacterium]|nr:tetratricopeptide repeat protein [Nitrospinota bacterium]